MVSSCKNCNNEFKYYPSQSKGIFCSNKCRGEYKVVESIKSGKYSLKTAFIYFERITEYKCAFCGINEWNGKKLTLQKDHIDGDTTNNTMSNLRYLCPNCHTQTPTWGSKNIKDENRDKLRTNKKNSSIG